jgi:gas vesicle protein
MHPNETTQSKSEPNLVDQNPNHMSSATTAFANERHVDSAQSHNRANLNFDSILTMRRSPILISAVIGALSAATVTYFFDPSHGRKRRAQLKDRIGRWQRISVFFTDRQVRNLRNHAVGWVASIASQFTKREIPEDEKLQNRIRSAMGRITNHPSAIEVSVNSGIVTLHGNVLSTEIEPLVRRIKSLRGVQRVINRLETKDIKQQGREKFIPAPITL